VDAAVQAGADAVGFVLYERSPRYVTPTRPPSWPPTAAVCDAGAAVRQRVRYKYKSCLRRQWRAPSSNFMVMKPADCLDATQAMAAPVPTWRAARIPLDGATPFDLLKFAA
jgi:phosphoribosylanthranilate isomerase